MQNPVLTRAVIVCVCLLSGAGLIARASKSEIVPTRAPLSELPFMVDDWRGQSGADFDEATLAILGVDEYINRVYASPTQLPVFVYVGYYQSQRQGDTMHSPLNCLPGAGWIPIDQRRISFPVRDANGERTIEVNSFVIEKGLDRQAVLYWYQSHGRVVASEYWGKVYTVLDAIRWNRTDGALVRIIVPVGRSETGNQAESERTAIRFVQAVFPSLANHLPS